MKYGQFKLHLEQEVLVYCYMSYVLTFISTLSVILRVYYPFHPAV